jgi:hypothetical protein
MSAEFPMAYLEQLAHDLGPLLLAAEADGRITRPYEIELIGGDDELLVVCQVDADGQWNLTTPDKRIDNAKLPITVTVVDGKGNRYQTDWSPASPL